MNKKFFRDLVPLVAICLVAALLLAIFNMITAGPIEQNALRAAQETRTRLLSAAATFEELELEEGSAMDSCYEGFDANGESVGYVVETTVGGYGGEIVVTVGFDTSNTITGINVGGENFSETAGLGAKAKEASFTDQFIGETVPLSLQKGTSGLNDGVIDAISGATITSTAVNGGVNSAGKFVMDLSGAGSSPNTASVQGFAGPVAVTLSLDDAGAITEITIGDDFFNETPGYGAGALEESFQAQFIGMVPPLALSDIDAIAGATITSTAVVDAINLVQAQLSGAVPVSAPADDAASVPAASENALKGSAQGFAGPVAVAVDVDENNAITAITVGDENFAETTGLGSKAQDDAFKAQFIGKTIPVSMDQIDAITGATITTEAVVKAINSIFEEPAAADEAIPVSTVVETPVGERFTGSAQGYAGPVVVEITVDNNTITSIKIGDDSFAETPGLGANALEEAFQNQFIGKTLPVSMSDIDAIAHATITTTAVIDAINSSAAVVDSIAAEEIPAVLTSSAQGYAGPVAVEITVDNNTITSIKIGDDSFAETPGLGANALEEAFQNQFIGKTLPVSMSDIDAIAHATITTKAVVDAINTAADFAADETPADTTAAATSDTGASGTATVEETPAEDTTAAATADASSSATPAVEEASETVRVGSAQGYKGPVVVTITVDASNTITSIVIGDETFVETKGFGTNVQRESYTGKFIGKTIPLADGDVDTLTGATATSKAVIAAINASEPVAEETDSDVIVLTGSAQGYAGPVAVEVSIDSSNTIVSLKIGDENFAETQGLGAKALEDEFKNQFIGKVLPIAASDIDAIAHATITTNAVIEALNQAAQQLTAE